jgi:RNA polymerase sigma-70 factor (ECF subfamily)
VSTGEALEKDLAARDPDVRLMLQVREDVEGAFESLVQRYQDRLVGVLAHVVGDQADAEDLAQEVFLRIYRSRKGYRPRAKFSTWMFTIANNQALNHLRTKGRKATMGFSPAADSQPMARAENQVPSREGTASTQLRQAELAAIVRDAVGALDDDQRMAVILAKFEEMRYAEIGEVMGRTEAAVKSLLARARMNLREQLDSYLRTGQRNP